MVSVHSFIMFGVSTRNGTCLSSGKRLERWSLSSMHLRRARAEFVPAVGQYPQVSNYPPQVINEDSVAVSAGGDGGADEGDEVMEVDNPAGILSSD